MAMTEHEGLQIYKDASGNSFILYPITKAHLVDGFEEAVMALAGIEDGLAKFAHAHAAGDIETGVLPAERGGTGFDNLAALSLSLGIEPQKIFSKIASYETAGSYQWTAPDLVDGKAYKIGVMIIGAGASGCGDTTGTGSSQINYCPGGASGFSRVMTKVVSPGDVAAIVIGQGGAKVTGATSGKSGGTSSFGGITALGGIGRGVTENPNTESFLYSFGACPGRTGNGFFGMDRSDLEPDNDCFLGIPAQCFNPFEQKEILASGGGAYTRKTDSGSAGTGGKNPLTGKGGGDGAYSVTGAATATAATEPGCGGGSASAKGTPTSGAGADGAVYIYFLGVADE